MLTVILAAGKSERFDGEQKATLIGPDKRRTALEYIIDSIKPKLCMVVHNSYAVRNVVAMIAHPTTTRTWKMLLWHYPLSETSGPLDTAYKSISSLSVVDAELLISYCDVILPKERVMDFVEECHYAEADAGITVFRSNNPRFQRNVLDTCNSGLFYFRSRKLFCEVTKSLPKDDTNGIPDVVFAMGRKLLFDVTKVVVDIGVPEDYEEWIA